MHFHIYKKNERAADFPSAIQIIGQDRFLKLKQIEKEIMLDYTQFGFFDRCMKLNELLAREFGCFLRFYERRNKFRYQLRQKLKTKNEVKAELSSCVLQKFNGYDLLRVELALDERIFCQLILYTSQHKIKINPFIAIMHQKFI